MTDVEVQPLARGQQLMLQRLLAAHVLSDDQAKTLYQELRQGDDNDASQQDPQSLEEAFQEINAQLTKAFGLEVATVSMSLDDKTTTTNRPKHTKYHAIINQHADAVAKQAFSHSFNPHERSMIRLILEKLVTDGVDTPCQRKDLVNLRAELVEPYKLTLQGAEHVVETLVQEQWLVVSESATQSRRDSMQATLQLGPRSYLELSHLLTDLGLPQEELPQFIFHRM